MITGHVHLVLATVMLPDIADRETPLSYLWGYGYKAFRTVPLTWGLLGISIAVVVIISALVTVGTIRRGVADAGGIRRVPVGREPGGLAWIAIGVGISAVVLFGSMIWNVVVLADINSPGKPALTIEVTGQQWWWSARYLNSDPARIFTTANEIHIPVGKPVRIKLLSRDVIHSFWVPALTGHTETIPGLTNFTWLEAANPGIYAGQCSEYCGLQHAHMGFLVVAQKQADFDAWVNDQLKPAPKPATPVEIRGEKEFVNRCGICHTVRGTEAKGIVAPDLTHVMSRQMLASNALRNTPATLAGWIADPQTQKPGTKMPILYLSGPELTDIVSYVRTLK